MELNMAISSSPEPIPISTDLIGGLIFSRDEGFQVLLLQRRGDDRFAPHSYQILYGHREKGESVLETIIREIHEETGLEVKAIWNISETLTFYEPSTGNIFLVPLLGVEVKSSREVRIDPTELEGYLWCDLTTALRNLPWPSQRRALSSLWTLAQSGFKEFMKVYSSAG
ncbi:MAG: NUDIX domain-containing protein [bacterium]